MTNRVLVDAGPLVAILAEGDQHHRTCVTQLSELQPPLLTCWPVVIETAYLLRRKLSAMARLVVLFDTRALQLLHIEQDEFGELVAIMNRYDNLGAQLADAALVYLARREGIETIFTLDRRDFSIYRGPKNRAFKLLPQD